MNREELKQRIKTLTEQIKSETDTKSLEQKTLELQKLVETYVAMTVPQNRMMTGVKDEQ